MADAIGKFQQLLRDLFQFDCADLDFGIYRIMNYKREAIEKFIEEKLPDSIASELDSGSLAEQAQIAEEMAEVALQIKEVMGEDALDAHGNLSETYHGTPGGKKYLKLKKKAVGGLSRAAVEVSIYNHLYAFFSRYYQDGDFISKRCYSKHQHYAIPYNGEEVYLHWANSDQYYIKTGEHFHDYDWKAPDGVAVHFRIKAADVEQNNVKGDKRFFLPLAEEAKWDADAREITIPFEYRPLTATEIKTYGSQKQQDKIIAEALDAILQQLGQATDALAALTGERRRNGKDESVSHLEYHLQQYTRRNTSDFFIHKDLAEFLSRELDFYLKSEVLNLDQMTVAGEGVAEGWFQQLKLIKRIGNQVIEFLAQMENFQKMLWEKRKFVTETQYCIALGSICEKFYPNIAVCEAQWAEWKALFHIDEDAINLFNSGKDRQGKRIAFMQAHPTLVLDTRHFDADFTDRLLESFDNLDRMTDGLLIHGENWQALNLLQEKYSEQVSCIYIDPPYNTGDSEILYKNGYKHSSWLSLMKDRLALATSLLSENPFLFIAIDDYEMADLCELVDKQFSFLQRNMIIVNHHPQGGKAKTLSATHEYMLACVKRESESAMRGYKNGEATERRSFQRAGTAESNFRDGRPNSFYAILVDPCTNNVVGIEPPPARGDTDYPTDKTNDGYIRVYPLGSQGEERVWRRSYKSCLQLVQDSKLQCSEKMTIYQLVESEERNTALFSNWIDKRYNAGTYGANLLSNILGRHNPFPYPKSIHTVGDAIFATGIGDGTYCVDYFAGSGTTGHAVINLNREDGGQRKFILVEMGEYFDTVLLPRIKKVAFAPEWKDGKPKRDATPEEAQRSPRIVQYIRLESYEDALDSIAFDDEAGQLKLEEQFDDYLIKYMLQWETKGSATLLNVAKLARPFTYRLRVHTNGETQERTADVPETFNYLLGLNVRTRRVHQDDGRRYLVYRGETRDAPGRNVAVIWRETDGWDQADFDRDRQFVAEQGLADGAATVYVNGDSCTPGAIAVEPTFKARMFAEGAR